MRKRILPRDEAAARPKELDLAAIATVHVSSESEDHPVENAFDARRGPGASRWVAGEPGDQTILLEFDDAQSINRVVIEVEETDVERTQEVTLAASSDGGKSYRELLRQEYNFAPPETTFEREEWQQRLDGVTHLKLWIRPDKGGAPVRAKVTALALE